MYIISNLIELINSYGTVILGHIYQLFGKAIVVSTDGYIGVLWLGWIPGTVERISAVMITLAFAITLAVVLVKLVSKGVQSVIKYE